MPTLSLFNVPAQYSPGEKTFQFAPAEVHRLRGKIAMAAKVSPKDVEIKISCEEVGILQDSGWVEPISSLFGSVQWFAKEERGDDVKLIVARAIVYFLNYHNLERGFFLTFQEDPAGTYFVEKGGVATLVPGGEPLPPYNQIAQTVYHITGYKSPGVITND